MKKYYAERHGLLTQQLQIDFDELLQYFRQVHKYFYDKDKTDLCYGYVLGQDKRGIVNVKLYFPNRFYRQVCCPRRKCILQRAYKTKRFGQFGNISKNMMNRHYFR